MIPLPSGVRVWIAAGHTDMRRGMRSLALQVQEGLSQGISLCRNYLDRILIRPHRPFYEIPISHAGDVLNLGLTY